MQLIRDDYQRLLHLSAHLSEERWAQAVAKADPVFFSLNDGALLMQIGEASRLRLLNCLQQEFGSAQ